MDYYNEFDPHAAQWLRNLIADGLLPKGEVDERDIRDVAPSDLRGFRRVHFFAGIGGWPLALELAGFEGECWTGSCPCQPFSAAGAGGGFDDERHLWPAFHWLIDQSRPVRIYGEQVASKVGLEWLDLVQSDLEGSGYASRAFDLCAAGIGAPHIRQRLFFVANTLSSGRQSFKEARRSELFDAGHGAREPAEQFGDSRSSAGELADPHGSGFDLKRRDAAKQSCERVGRREPRNGFVHGGVADSKSVGLQRRQDDRDDGRRQRASGQRRSIGLVEHTTRDGRIERRPEPSERGVERGCGAGGVEKPKGDGWDGTLQPSERQEISGILDAGANVRPGPANGFWRDADWIGCTDGKWRAVEPGTFPLAHGISFKLGSGGAHEGKSRAKMLKGYGNAICVPLAVEFIKATM